MTPTVKASSERHPRFHVHVTPTGAYFMNQIETCFGTLDRQAIRRGSFNGARALIDAIDVVTSRWKGQAAPFMWVRAADSMLASAVSAAEGIAGA